MGERAHRVLVVGVGSIGERHCRCFRATGRAEVGFVEINPTLRGAIAERYGVESAFDSLDAALAGGFGVAVVATPAPLHVPQTIRLVEAEMDVLIEKPLSTSLAGVDELRDLTARAGRTVGVAYVYRAFPALTAMRDAISAGRFGKPLQVVVVGGQHFPTFRPAYRDIYYKDRATGGGAIQDALTHLVNAAEWLVGPVDRLFADAAHQALEGVEVEDTVSLVTRHGSVLGSFSLNQFQAPNEITLTVLCERGAARFEAHLHRWRWMAGPQDTWHDEAFGTSERDTVYIAQANAFLDAVEGRRPVLCTLDEAAQTLRVNLAALVSADRPAWTPVAPSDRTS